jgi:beta-fructofuranosidase
VLVAFHNRGEHGFVGAISDPMPVAWDGKRLSVIGF